MKNATAFLRIGAPLLAAVLYSSASFAGSAEVTGQDNSTMKYEYSGDMVRMSTQEDNSYMVLRDGKIYMVSFSDGQWMVMDGSSALSFAGGMARGADSSLNDQKVLSMEPTGDTEEHAGAKGKVYDIEIQTSDGKIEKGQIVLSDDPKALEYRDAMLTFARAMGKALGESMEQQDSLYSKMMGMNKSVLRYGDDMRVTALSDETIDPARFELPAEPIDMSGLGSILSRMGQGGAPQEGGAENSPEEGQSPNPLSEVGKALGGLLQR